MALAMVSPMALPVLPVLLAVREVSLR